MTDAVKSSPGRRAYDSTRRRAQAAQTRRDVLESARRLFERDGYAATTVPVIAAEAGVAQKTVYSGFGTKSGLLHAVWDVALGGDDSGTPVAERQWYREVLDEPDPRRQLALNARNSRAGKERVGPLLQVIREGAAHDPGVAGLWATIQTEFHANQRVVVESLHRKGALKAGLDVDRATDLLWTLNHPSTWQLLVQQRGWSPMDYEAWFAEASATSLLG